MKSAIRRVAETSVKTGVGNTRYEVRRRSKVGHLIMLETMEWDGLVGRVRKGVRSEKNP